MSGTSRLHRLLAMLCLALLGVVATGGGAVRPVLAQDATAALHSGDYEAAIGGLTRKAREDTKDPEVHRTLVQALAEVGRYQEAQEAAESFQAQNPRSADLQNVLGEVLLARGRTADAEAAFKKAIAGGAPDALVAELNLAVLRYDRGQREEARQGFRRLIEAYNRGKHLSSEELAAVAVACRYLGADDPQLFKDALKAFDEAIDADADNLDARVKLAELFLEKYNGPDAASTVKEILEKNPSHPRALVALARTLDFDGSPGVPEAVEKALKVNPNLAEARVFQAEVMLDQEDFDQAAKEAEAVLADNASFQPALAALAAARYLQGDKARFEEARQKALALNPKNAELYNTLAERCVRNRLYREAVDFAQQAVALDPRSWRGLGILGLNQLRVGAAFIEDGRKSLEASFKGDPYNVWIKNTLDLLDTFPKYREAKTEHFQLFVHGNEAELLSPYLGDLAEETYAKLAVRYQYRPPTPIRVEVYPSHADFSVRTVGLAGLGALGACFGPVLAIDSPSAREVGRFNWGSTLWHELAHSFTLGLSEHKVPRWLTEGLSVHEEHRARPGWGDDVTLSFLRTMKDGKLLPLRDLNNGFVRPTGPEQVGLSYYQASLVVEWIEAQHGFPAILDLLKAYRDGRTTAEAFQKVLGTSLDDFDKGFMAYLNQRFATALAALRPRPDPHQRPERTERPSTAQMEERAKADPGDFGAQMAAGVSLFEEKKLAEAAPYLERARALFPEYGEDDSPYWFLALIYKEQKDDGKTADMLARLVAINENHYRAHLELAALLEKQGDLAGAAAILERALYISPSEPAVHERLASLYTRLHQPARVVRARQSLVALDPVDRPEALYQLALAQLEAGDTAAARRDVLRALELAPRFQRAQELLLRLHPGARPDEGGTKP